jgi:hypothetical protein
MPGAEAGRPVEDGGLSLAGTWARQPGFLVDLRYAIPMAGIRQAPSTQGPRPCCPAERFNSPRSASFYGWRAFARLLYVELEARRLIKVIASHERYRGDRIEIEGALQMEGQALIEDNACWDRTQPGALLRNTYAIRQ